MAQTKELERFGRYTLLHRLGYGDVSEVHLAHDPEARADRRLMVIKRVRADLQDNNDVIKAFIDEEGVLRRLDHPNVVRVRDFGRIDGRSYLALEHVWGETLLTLSRLCLERRIPFPVRAALYVGARVALALDHAHTRPGPRGERSPIIHRDVTLNNVLVGYGGEVKVLDFGIAKAEGRLSKTAMGQIKGNPEYLAPEQLAKKPVAAQTDVFQLGVLLYKLLVGRRPFDAADEAGFIRALMNGDVTKPSAVVEGFPTVLEMILLKAMARAPADRFASAGEMARALEELLPAAWKNGGQQLATLIDKLTGERYAQQRAYIEQRVEGLEGDAGDGALLLRSSGEEEPAQLSVELGSRFEVEQLGKEEADRAADVPWATSVYMVFSGDEALPTTPAVQVKRDETAGEEVAPEPEPEAAAETEDKPVLRVVHRPAATAEEKREVETEEMPGVAAGEDAEAQVEAQPDAGEEPEAPTAPAAASERQPARAPAGAAVSAWLDRLRQGRGLLFAGAAAAALVLLLLLVALWPEAPAQPTIKDQIGKGQPKEVVAAVQAIPEAERSGEQELLLGHAHNDLEQYYEAFDAYARAINKKVKDQRVLDFMLEELDAKKADDVVEVFTAWPDGTATEPLLTLVESGRWWERHHALRALQARGEEDRVDLQAFAIRDLKGAKGCPGRRRGLRMLVRVAKDRKALAAVQAARSRGWENNCMLQELSEAERKLSARFR